MNAYKTYIFYDKYIDGLEFHIKALDETKARQYLAFRLDEAHDIGYNLAHITEWEMVNE